MMKRLLPLALSLFLLGFDPAGGISRGYAFESLLRGGEVYGHDILKDRQVAAATRQLLGADYNRFTEVLNVSPPVKVVGRYVFGQGCEPHNCVETGALIVVDTKQHEVWAALTDGPMRKAWPGPIAGWPAPVRQVVKSAYE